MNIEIIIPTCDGRERFLRRALAFYGRHGIHPVVARGNHWRPMGEALAATSKPYVSFMADDDFLIPSFLGKAAEFIETHPEYMGIGGDVQMFQAWHGLVWHRRRIEQRSIEDSSPAERWASYLSYAACQPIVVRNDAVEWILEQINHFKITWRFAEFLFYSAIVIHGKVRILPELGLLREAHVGQMGGGGVKFPAWIESPEFRWEWPIVCGLLRKWGNFTPEFVDAQMKRWFDQRRLVNSMKSPYLRRGWPVESAVEALL